MLIRPYHLTIASSTSNQVVPLTTGKYKAVAATIQAWSTNTGQVFIGSSTLSTASTNCGIQLDANDVLSINPQQFGFAAGELDLSEVYMITTTSGDGLSVLWFGSAQTS